MLCHTHSFLACLRANLMLSGTFSPPGQQNPFDTSVLGLHQGGMGHCLAFKTGAHFRLVPGVVLSIRDITMNKRATVPEKCAIWGHLFWQET